MIKKIGQTQIMSFVFSKRFLIIIGIVLALTLAYLILPSGALLFLIIVSFHGMVPLALTAEGEVLNEKGGLFNIGLEGILLITAFAAVFAAELTGSWIIGVIAGVGLGALISFIFGVLATYGKGDQVILGVGINMFASGIIAYGIWQIWRPGYHTISSSSLRIPGIMTPWGKVSWMIFVAIGMCFVIYYILNRTRFGVWIRAAGENAFVTDTRGIDVYKVRIIACTIGGALAGLAGAYLSLDWTGMITKGLPAGRGFIALACVVFGGIDPILAFGGAILFGFFDGLSVWLQNSVWVASMMKGGTPFFVKMIPYLVTLSVVAIFVGKRRFPKEIGEPYRRG